MIKAQDANTNTASAASEVTPQSLPSGELVERFTISYRDGRYFVSIPNYRGGDVVPAQALLAYETRIKAVEAERDEALEAMRFADENRTFLKGELDGLQSRIDQLLEVAKALDNFAVLIVRGKMHREYAIPEHVVKLTEAALSVQKEGRDGQ